MLIALIKLNISKEETYFYTLNTCYTPVILWKQYMQWKHYRSLKPLHIMAEALDYSKQEENIILM